MARKNETKNTSPSGVKRDPKTGMIDYTGSTGTGKTEQLIGIIVVCLIVLLIGGGVTWWAVSSHNKKVAEQEAVSTSQEKLEGVTTTPSSFTDDGALVFVGNRLISPDEEKNYEDLIPVDVYMDYNCPGCGTAERTLGDTYEEMMDKNQIRLRIHPLAFLNGTSTDKYSERAANAVIQVAQQDPEHVMDYIRYIMSEDIQPGEGSDYVPVSDEQLQQYAKDAGVVMDDYTTLTDKKYDDWLVAMTEYTTNRPELKRADVGSFATPLITIDGKQFPMSSGTTNIQIINDFTRMVNNAEKEAKLE